MRLLMLTRTAASAAVATVAGELKQLLSLPCANWPALYCACLLSEDATTAWLVSTDRPVADLKTCVGARHTAHTQALLQLQLRPTQALLTTSAAISEGFQFTHTHIHVQSERQQLADCTVQKAVDHHHHHHAQAS